MQLVCSGRALELTGIAGVQSVTKTNRLRGFTHHMRTRIPALLAATVAVLALASPATAAEVGWTADGWKHWWLPDDYSTHGKYIDSLFTATFWLCMVTWALVQIAMIVFLIKYRHRKDRKKAIFTHGNTRLEMCWTLAPAVILAALAVWNKGVWDRFRFNPDLQRDDVAKILVIGQQFKWNVIYPGPDGKFGKYLDFPKPTDKQWPDGKTRRGVAGPAFLPYTEAVTAINQYIDAENPLGKDMLDPDGKDDDWTPQPGREIAIPAHRPVEVQLSSKDVIHSFFLPNFRVKLDAVPGMRGAVSFTSTKTSTEREKESERTLKIKDLQSEFAADETLSLRVAINADTKGAVKDPKKEEYLFQDKSNPKKPVTIIRHANPLTKARVDKLAEAGIEEVTVYEPGIFEIVCEELCGGQHFTMRGELRVLEPDVYAERFEGKKRPAATQPAVAIAR